MSRKAAELKPLLERIRAEMIQRAGVEPDDSPWKPVAQWAKAWSLSRAQSERYAKVAVDAGIMEVKRGRIAGASGARYAMLYREVPTA